MIRSRDHAMESPIGCCSTKTERRRMGNLPSHPSEFCSSKVALAPLSPQRHPLGSLRRLSCHLALSFPFRTGRLVIRPLSATNHRRKSKPWSCQDSIALGHSERPECCKPVSAWDGSQSMQQGTTRRDSPISLLAETYQLPICCG